MNFIIGLPKKNQGHDLGWGMIDMLARLVKFLPTKKDVKILELARLFIKHFYRL